MKTNPIVPVGIVWACLRMLTGCATVETIHEPGRTLCEVQNTSWYFIDRYPLASGDPDHPNERTCLYFTDNLNVDTNRKILEWAVKHEGMTKVGITENRWHKTDVLPFLIQRYALKTYAELL